MNRRKFLKIAGGGGVILAAIGAGFGSFVGGHGDILGWPTSQHNPCAGCEQRVCRQLPAHPLLAPGAWVVLGGRPTENVAVTSDKASEASPDCGKDNAPTTCNFQELSSIHDFMSGTLV